MVTPKQKIGRNSPCPCGSGKKFKQCCIRKEIAATDLQPQAALPTNLQFLEQYSDTNSRELLMSYRMDPTVIRVAEFWLCAGQSAGVHKNLKASTACFQKAIKLDPKSYSALVNLAANFGAEKKYDDALQLLANVPNRINRKEIIKANLLQDMGRHEEAIKYYELAIEDEPEFFLPYARILNSLRFLGSPLIEYWLDRGIRAVPTSAEIGNAYCFFLFGEDRIQELAEADWVDQLESEAGRPDMIGLSADDPAIIVECQLFRRIAQIELSDDVALLKKTIEEFAGRFNVGRNACDIGRAIAILSARLGVPEGVNAGLQHVCKNCLEDRNRIAGPVELFEADAYALLDNHAKAISLCDSVLADEPDNKSALWRAWWSLDEVGRTAEAIPIAERLAELDENAVSIYYNLGYMCGKEGLLGKASYYYKKQIEACPEHREAVENLGFIHLLAGALDDADSSMERFRQIVESGSEEELTELVAQTGLSEQDIINELLEVSNDGSRLLTDLLIEKQRTYDELRSHAAKILGQSSYVADLIKLNNNSKPVFGSYSTIKPAFPKCADIGRAMSAGHGPDFENVRFQIDMQQKGDISPVIASIEQSLPGWRNLPDIAINSITESEKRLLDGTSIDHAPEILGFAKSVEIALSKMVFDSFRNQGIGFQVRREIEAVLHDAKKDKTVRLASFVEKGRKLELGSMAFVLRLCTGRTVIRSQLVRSLREFVCSKWPQLIDSETLASLEKLANEYRNPAAHDRNFDEPAARDARELAMELLSIVLQT